jgi:hypothetical protein
MPARGNAPEMEMFFGPRANGPTESAIVSEGWAGLSALGVFGWDRFPGRCPGLAWNGALPLWKVRGEMKTGWTKNRLGGLADFIAASWDSATSPGFGANGAAHASPGQRPGCGDIFWTEGQGPGRIGDCFGRLGRAFSPRRVWVGSVPRALPRAGVEWGFAPLESQG